MPYFVNHNSIQTFLYMKRLRNDVTMLLLPKTKLTAYFAIIYFIREYTPRKEKMANTANAIKETANNSTNIRF